MTSVEQTLAQGIELHRAGQLADAERAYRQVLSWEPAHPYALHQLGILALQTRQFDAAIELLSQAVRGERNEPAFHANLAEAYRHAGNLAEAAECYRRVIKLNPNLAQAQLMLGVVLRGLGRLDEATEALRAAARLAPDDVPARTCLGDLLLDQGQFRDAEATFRRALRNDPQSGDLQFRLASALGGQGKQDEAAECYQALLAAAPDHADAHNNLAILCKNQGRLDEAAFHYGEAVRLKPDHAAAHVNRGLLELGQDRLEAAEASLRRAVKIDPTLARAHRGLAEVLQKQGRLDEALAAAAEAVRLAAQDAAARLTLANVHQAAGRAQEAAEACREALRLEPANAEAHSNLGLLWAGEGRHDEAIAHLRRAVELKPTAKSYSNLANSLLALGLQDEAIAAHRAALALPDSSAGLHSNLVYGLNYHPGYDPDALFAEHRAWGARWAEPLASEWRPHANDRTPDRRLRVGYVSPNFKSHAVNFFVEPIFASHDHAQFEIFGYCDVEHPDETTQRLRGHADQWRDTRFLTDAQVARQVREDQIDVLVDLTGHISGGRRLLAFARKPAPVQITYIGYQNTTGMRAMDYRLTDAYADPPGQTDALHTEQLERLPVTFFCYLPSADAPEVGPLPAASAGYVTFGSVNAFTKVTPEVLSAWAALLGRVPNSRLIIRADMTASLRTRLEETFAAGGIDAGRLELVNRLPRPEYLDLIKRMDIALDPFPFNGHTTTCDCLWQGVPVVTFSGQTYVSRFGGSGLHTLGLDELIAPNEAEYLDVAAALAADVERLGQLRANLRERMAASPLLDFVGFTRNLETAYRRMWRDWCAGGA